MDRILNFKVLFCADRKLLCMDFPLCGQFLLHFFQFVQITAKALGFAVVLAVEVMQNHCLTAAEFFDFLGQRGDLLGKLAALVNLQRRQNITVHLQILLLRFLVSKLLRYRMIILQNRAVIVDLSFPCVSPFAVHQQTVLQHYQTAAQPFQRFRNMLYSVFNDLGQLGKLGFQFPQQLVVRADLAV